MLTINPSNIAKVWWLLLYAGALACCLSTWATPWTCFSLCVACALTALGHGFYWRHVLAPQTPVAISYEPRAGWLIRCRDEREWRGVMGPGTVVWRHLLMLVIHTYEDGKIKKHCLCLWPDSLPYAARRQLASAVALYSN